MLDGKNIELKQRDLVIVLFPFSDFSEFKKRPAIVLSGSDYNVDNDDVLVCGITSKLDSHKLGVLIKNCHLDSGNLEVNSEIRIDKLLLVNKQRVYFKLGTLNVQKYSEVYNKILNLISPK